MRTELHPVSSEIMVRHQTIVIPQESSTHSVHGTQINTVECNYQSKPVDENVMYLKGNPTKKCMINGEKIDCFNWSKRYYLIKLGAISKVVVFTDVVLKTIKRRILETNYSGNYENKLLLIKVTS